MRVAAIDCGTNSIRLLIADVEVGSGQLVDVTRQMTVVRLGQGVDKTGEFAAEALDRTFAAAEDYAKQCQQAGVEKIRFVATSATRDARNRQVFIDGIKERLGVAPEVVSGEEEAALSFSGALSALDRSIAGPYLVVDLGGGSTELVLGTTTPTAAYSMDVGCVRMTERHFSDSDAGEVSEKVFAERIAAATADIEAALVAAAKVVPLGQTRALIGLAGTITTVTAQALGLSAYNRDLINGATLSLAEAKAAAAALTHSSKAELRSLGFMHPGRVDVISAGALVWRTILDFVAEQVSAAGGTLNGTTTSEHDILDGIALSLAE